MKRLKELELALHRVKFPDYPEHARYTQPWSDKTANGLEKCIVFWIQGHGGQAERIKNTGRYIDGRKVVTDVLGVRKTIGSGQYIPGTGTNGTSDIHAVVKGRSVKIEVKIGKDKMSAAQKKYKADTERAGGIYFVATNFDEFVNEWEKWQNA